MAYTINPNPDTPKFKLVPPEPGWYNTASSGEDNAKKKLLYWDGTTWSVTGPTHRFSRLGEGPGSPFGKSKFTYVVQVAPIPCFYTVFRQGLVSGEWFPVLRYSATTEAMVLHMVANHLISPCVDGKEFLPTARQMLTALGWEIRPVYAAPQPTPGA